MAAIREEFVEAPFDRAGLIIVRPEFAEQTAGVYSYVEGCIGLLADAHPGPDRATASELAMPIIDELETAPMTSFGRHDNVAEALRKAYHPAYSTSWLLDDRWSHWAGRELTTAVLAGAQQRAFETNNRALTAEVTGLVCDLAERNVAVQDANINPDRIDSRLITILQRTVAKQMAEWFQTALPDEVVDYAPLPWIESCDAGRVRDLLAGALLVDKLDLAETSTVDFLLEQYQLDPAEMKAAWAMGYSFNDAGVTPVSIVRDNLQRIATVEKIQPGSAKWLHDNKGIRCFTRISPELAEYLYLGPDYEFTETASVTTGTFDNLSTFLFLDDPGTLDRLRTQVAAAGRRFDYREVACFEEWLVNEFAAGANSTVHKIFAVHSNDETARLGDPVMGPGFEHFLITADDLLAFEPQIREANRHVRAVRWFACMSAIKDAFGGVYGRIVTDRVSNDGLSGIGGVFLNYNKDEGFVLTKNRRGRPAPLGDVVQQSGLMERAVELVSPLVVPCDTSTAEERMAMHTMNTMRAVAGF